MPKPLYNNQVYFKDGAILGGATDNLSIDEGGALTLNGAARYQRHFEIPAMVDGLVANQPTPVDFFTAAGLQYSSVAAKYAFCDWEVPQDWDGGDIYFELDWTPDSGATSGTDAVRWTVEYRSLADDLALNNGTSVTLDNGTGGDTGDYAQYAVIHTRLTVSADNANQPLHIGDHIYFKISRDVARTTSRVR